MGYELARFVGEIDREFQCTICAMVLENPMQSPCEHIFCNECIVEWVKVESSCPVDRSSLALDDLKPTPRYFRNLLDKMELKCSFESKGCQSILPLEHLNDHLTECRYNPNSEVICDKGCSFKMARCEYEDNDCFIHLANRIKRQEDYFNKILSSQAEEVRKLSYEVNQQQEQISKLTNKGSPVRSEVTHKATPDVRPA